MCLFLNPIYSWEIILWFSSLIEEGKLPSNKDENQSILLNQALLEKSIQKIKTIPFILRAQGLTFLLYSW